MILSNDLFNDELNKINKDYHFVVRCINSCVNSEQLVNALKLITNFNAKWITSLYYDDFNLANAVFGNKNPDYLNKIK